MEPDRLDSEQLSSPSSEKLDAPLPTVSPLSPRHSHRHVHQPQSFIDKADSVLRAALNYPRTERIDSDNEAPSVRISTEVLDLDHIREQVRNEPELIALRVRDKVDRALAALTNVAQDQSLASFDSVRLYCGSQCILCIALTLNHCGRSVCLDLDDYNRRMTALLGRSNPTQGDDCRSRLVGALSALAVAVGIITYAVRYRTS
jgi:hypothetical protein